MTGGNREAPKLRVLDRVPCIYYSIQFRKDKYKNILALLDSGNEVNAMTPAYTAYLGLQIGVNDVGAQKIEKSSLATYSMVIAAFQVVNKLGCSWFF